MKPEFITNTDWQIVKEMYPNELENIVEKLNKNYPIQYIIGFVEFCDTKIKVNENVLIPRFETEYLVEKLIDRLKVFPEKTLSIVDIGTGSGCISIALAKKINQSFEGVDISTKALLVAEYNGIENNVNIKWRKLNILKKELPKNYDVILANPPYVDRKEEVDPKTKYEPQNAIFAEKNGLQFYERILSIIKNRPKLIAFEIGCTQSKAITNMAKEKFPNAHISVEKDLTGRIRYLFIENT